MTRKTSTDRESFNPDKADLVDRVEAHLLLEQLLAELVRKREERKADGGEQT